MLIRVIPKVTFVRIAVLVGLVCPLQFVDVQAVAPSPGQGSVILDTDPTIARLQEFRIEQGFRADAAFVRQLRTAHAMHPGAPPQPWGTYFTPEEEASLKFRQDVSNASAEPTFATYLQTNRGEFAGMYMDQKAGGRLKVLMTGHLAVHQAALKQLFKYPNQLDVTSAAETLDTLQRLKTQIDSDIPTLKTDGIPLRGLGIDIAKNAVVVDLGAVTAASRAEFSRRYGDHSYLMFRATDSQLTDRATVVSPVYAGGEEIQRGAECSAGFVAYDASYYYILTAGHCEGGSTNWFQGLAGSVAGITPQPIGAVTANAEGGPQSTDSEVIRITQQTPVSDWVGNRVINQYDANNIPYFLAIGVQQGQGAGNPGDNVCFFGKTSAVANDCGTLQTLGYTFCPPNGIYCYYNERLANVTTAPQAGDSGGPVFNPSNSPVPMALGTVSGFVGSQLAYEGIYEATAYTHVNLDFGDPVAHTVTPPPYATFSVPQFTGPDITVQSTPLWLSSRTYTWDTHLCGTNCATPLSQSIYLTEGAYVVRTTIHYLGSTGNYQWTSDLFGINGNQASPDLSRSIFLGNDNYSAYSQIY